MWCGGAACLVPAGSLCLLGFCAGIACWADAHRALFEPAGGADGTRAVSCCYVAQELEEARKEAAALVELLELRQGSLAATLDGGYPELRDTGGQELPLLVLRLHGLHFSIGDVHRTVVRRACPAV